MDEIRGERVRARSLSNAAYRTWEGAKRISHEILYPNSTGPDRVVFILGCQRSGTTMLSDLLQHDPRSRSYGEVSVLTNADPFRQLRLNDWEAVRATIGRQRAPMVVTKPLVESQNALDLLSFFPRSRAVWMLRHYRPVAASFISKWGAPNSIRDVRDAITAGSENWRSEGLSDETRDILAAHYHDGMDGHAAAALFWYARNRLWLDALLGDDDRLILCNYAHLAGNCAPVLRSLYEFLEQPYPGDWVTFRVQPEVAATRRDVHIDPGIEELCDELWADLLPFVIGMTNRA